MKNLNRTELEPYIYRSQTEHKLFLKHSEPKETEPLSSKHQNRTQTQNFWFFAISSLNYEATAIAMLHNANWNIT